MIICGFLVFSSIIVFISHIYFPSPNEKKLMQKIDELNKQRTFLNEEVDKVTSDLLTLRERDAMIYRSIYQRDPLPEDIWQVGMIDSTYLDKLARFDNDEILSDIVKKLDMISKKVHTQTSSFNEIVGLIEKKNEMLSSIPSIQPVSNKDLKYIASGFGMRIHPIYRVAKMHTGIDFTAPSGVDVYATGDGNIETAGNSGGGYGNEIVIDHGYGYKTRYAHLSAFKANRGQKVKRGDLIGKVGSTGASVGPHLHYEVEYNKTKVDPALFFYNDLSNKQYEEMLKISSAEGQSFD
jgi:murein DD-endopeptidase MepM/ murein hydrolase activator NlpD